MKRAILFVVNICLCFALWPATQAWPQEKPAWIAGCEVCELEPGKSIERLLSPWQVHAYRITLATAQCLKVMVEQDGIDIVVTLFGPDGRPLGEVDRSSARFGEQLAWFLAENAGSYRIEVRAVNPDAREGRYKIKVAEPRAATPADAQRIAAQRLFAEGSRLREMATPEPWRRAIASYRESLALWQASGERARAAYALYHIGRISRSLGEHQQALEANQQALQLWRESENRQAEASTLVELGMIYDALGEQQKAFDQYLQALPPAREVGAREEEAIALVKLGQIYTAQGERQKAIDCYEQAVSPGWTFSVNEKEAAAFDALSQLYREAGETQKACDCYRRALAARAPTEGNDLRAPVNLPQDCLMMWAVKKVQPAYPSRTKKTGVLGKVEARVVISENGEVIESVALSSPEKLRGAALEAARQWFFLNNTRVKMQGILTLIFTHERASRRSKPDVVRFLFKEGSVSQSLTVRFLPGNRVTFIAEVIDRATNCRRRVSGKAVNEGADQDPESDADENGNQYFADEYLHQDGNCELYLRISSEGRHRAIIKEADCKTGCAFKDVLMFKR